MTKFRRELGMRIFEARDKSAMSQDELAMRVGVSRGMVSRWECGRNGFRVDHLLRLAKALGVSVGWLVGEHTQ